MTTCVDLTACTALTVIPTPAALSAVTMLDEETEAVMESAVRDVVNKPIKTVTVMLVLEDEATATSSSSIPR